MNMLRNTPLLHLFPVLLLLFILAACAEDEPDTMMEEEERAEMNEEMGTRPGMPPADAAVRVEDGVQVVDIEIGQRGYTPGRIRLEAGVPARLVFTRRIEGECPSQVQIPAVGIAKTDLPMNEPVAIEFTPEEAGTYTFTCGMDMMEGTLVVAS